MPKTTCPDCKKTTASTKPSCPRCGFPLTPPQMPRRREITEGAEQTGGLAKILWGVSGLCAALLLLQD